jgi:hypothetical protein
VNDGENPWVNDSENPQISSFFEFSADVLKVQLKI